MHLQWGKSPWRLRLGKACGPGMEGHRWATITLEGIYRGKIVFVVYSSILQYTSMLYFLTIIMPVVVSMYIVSQRKRMDGQQ